VSAETERDAALVRLSGELDISTAPHLEDELNGLVDRGVRHVTLDLAELSSTGPTGSCLEGGRAGRLPPDPSRRRPGLPGLDR
jgi:anti-anti-sigma factor